MAKKKFIDLPEEAGANRNDFIVIIDTSTGQEKKITEDNFLKHIRSGQNAGVKGYPDKAAMDSDSSQEDRVIALVTNDSDNSKNGFYRWDDAGGSWVKAGGFFGSETVKQWASAEAFELSNITYSTAGNIETADLIWPDGENGSISDLQEDSKGRLSSIRYNYVLGSGKYITLTVNYDSSWNVSSTNLTATGF